VRFCLEEACGNAVSPANSGIVQYNESPSPYPGRYVQPTVFSLLTGEKTGRAKKNAEEVYLLIWWSLLPGIESVFIAFIKALSLLL